MEHYFTLTTTGHKIACSDMLIKNTSEDQLDVILNQIRKNWSSRRQGYRKGVFLVPLNKIYFKSNIVKLRDEDYLLGRFESRVEKELPRKKIFALAKKKQLMVLRSVDAVVYSRETLAEGNENTDPLADFEILIVIKKVVDGDQPMPPDTMMYNFFKANGGTDMKCSDASFVKQLRESFEFWKDKAIINS